MKTALVADESKSADEDPLREWERPQRDVCPICLVQFQFDYKGNLTNVGGPLSPPNLRTAKAGSTWPGMFTNCCGKYICKLCLANMGRFDGKTLIKEHGVEAVLDMLATGNKEALFSPCPFCRGRLHVQRTLDTELKLANAGDPDAMHRVGSYYLRGREPPQTIQQNLPEALRWNRRASEAGSGEAAFVLGACYHNGVGGVEQDDARSLEYYTRSGMLGCARAFVALGDLRTKRGETEEAMLNYRKAAMCGLGKDQNFDCKVVYDGFKDGHITKEAYELTRKRRQAALEEVKSTERKIDPQILQIQKLMRMSNLDNESDED